MKKTWIYIKEPYRDYILHLNGEHVTFNTEDILMVGSIDEVYSSTYNKRVFKRKIWFKGVESPYLFCAKNKSELSIEDWDTVCERN